MRLRYPDHAPEGFAALSAFGHYVNTGTALEPALLSLINLRASLLNGCEFCIGLHTAELRKLHEPQTRIDAIAVGSGANAFTPREQAALRWTEILTELGGSHASDEDYVDVTRFFRDKDLVDLTFAIANINAWNRMGIAFRPGWHADHGVPLRRTADAPSVPAADSPAAASESVIDDDGGKVAQD